MKRRILSFFSGLGCSGVTGGGFSKMFQFKLFMLNDA